MYTFIVRLFITAVAEEVNNNKNNQIKYVDTDKTVQNKSGTQDQQITKDTLGKKL